MEMKRLMVPIAAWQAVQTDLSAGSLPDRPYYCRRLQLQLIYCLAQADILILLIFTCITIFPEARSSDLDAIPHQAGGVQLATRLGQPLLGRPIVQDKHNKASHSKVLLACYFLVCRPRALLSCAWWQKRSLATQKSGRYAC